MRHVLRTSVIALLVLVAAGQLSPAFAQGDTFSVGYQILHVGADGSDGGTTFRAGFGVDYAHALAGPISFLGAFDSSRKTRSELDGTYQASASMWTFGAGLRVARFGNSPINPFFQIVGGVSRVGASIEVDDVEVADDAATRPMLEGAGGVMYKFIGTLGIVGQASYRRVFAESDTPFMPNVRVWRFYFGGVVFLD